MLRIKRDNTYWWPVDVKYPSDSGDGQIRKAQIKILYEPLLTDEMLRIKDDLSDSGKVSGKDTVNYLRGIIPAKILNWEGIKAVDEEGKERELECTEETKRMMLNIPWFERAVTNGLKDCSSGVLSKN